MPKVYVSKDGKITFMVKVVRFDRTAQPFPEEILTSPLLINVGATQFTQEQTNSVHSPIALFIKIRA